MQLETLDDPHKEFELTRGKPSNTGYDRLKKELKLCQIDDEYLKLFHVYSDSQLREFVLREGCEFYAGCAYYEFKNEVEHVSEDKQLVFMQVSSNYTISTSMHMLNCSP